MTLPHARRKCSKRQSAPRPAALSRRSPCRPRSTPSPPKNTTTPPKPTETHTPPLQRRARLLDRQGPRHQRPLPRLVPADQPHPDRALHRHHLHRPRPARRRRFRRPPSRAATPRGQRATTQAAQTPPPKRRGPHQRGQPAAIEPAAPRQPAQLKQQAPPGGKPPPPAPGRHRHTGISNRRPNSPNDGLARRPAPARSSVRPKREHQPRLNVKTSSGALGDSNPRPPGHAGRTGWSAEQRSVLYGIAKDKDRRLVLIVWRLVYGISMEKTTLYLPEDLQRELSDRRAGSGEPQSELVREALGTSVCVAAASCLDQDVRGHRASLRGRRALGP